jgi:hypothetical protein
MASFEEVGIRWLSSSSVSNFCACPAAWVAKTLIGSKGGIVPAIARHNAVHAGVRTWLHGSMYTLAEDVALREYELNVAELPVSEEMRKEQDAILPMLHESFKVFLALEHRKPPLLSKVFDTVWLDGISVPFVCKPDYVFDDCIVNLKTSHRLPSTCIIRERQDAGLQAKKYKLPVIVGYVTMKKSCHFALTGLEMQLALDELVADAFSVQTFIEGVTSAEQALAMLPMNPTHYLWTPELLQAAQSRLPQLPKQEMIYGLDYAGKPEVRTAPVGSPSGGLLPDRRPGDAGGELQGRDQAPAQGDPVLGAAAGEDGR